MSVMVAVTSILIIGCGPAKVLDVVNVAPNETAWSVPLDTETKAGQVKFNSVEFLNTKKVAAKRIMVDKTERSLGRAYFDYEWIPVVRVIKVDRSLVTREWTDDEGRGTSDKKEGIGVQTKDSIKLRVGLTITASIDEDDASTYLYYHGEKPLKDVVDTNIRSYAVAELTKEYSQLNLTEAQTNSPAIYDKLLTDARRVFKDKGITIQYLGNSEGVTYGNKEVQDGINRSYLAEQDRKTADQEQKAQNIRNQTKINAAETEANAALKLFAAKEAAQFQNTLQIALIQAQAQKTMAEKWNGGLPTSILPANSPLLMNLGNTNSK